GRASSSSLVAGSGRGVGKARGAGPTAAVPGKASRAANKNHEMRRTTRLPRTATGAVAPVFLRRDSNARNAINREGWGISREVGQAPPDIPSQQAEPDLLRIDQFATTAESVGLRVAWKAGIGRRRHGINLLARSGADAVGPPSFGI